LNFNTNQSGISWLGTDSSIKNNATPNGGINIYGNTTINGTNNNILGNLTASQYIVLNGPTNIPPIFPATIGKGFITSNYSQNYSEVDFISNSNQTNITPAFNFYKMPIGGLSSNTVPIFQIYTDGTIISRGNLQAYGNLVLSGGGGIDAGSNTIKTTGAITGGSLNVVSNNSTYGVGTNGSVTGYSLTSALGDIVIKQNNDTTAVGGLLYEGFGYVISKTRDFSGNTLTTDRDITTTYGNIFATSSTGYRTGTIKSNYVYAVNDISGNGNLYIGGNIYVGGLELYSIIGKYGGSSGGSSGNGVFTTDISGSGNLYIGKAATINGNLTTNGNLIVNSMYGITNTGTVTGAKIISTGDISGTGNLYIGGTSSYINGNLTTNGNIIVNYGSLNVNSSQGFGITNTGIITGSTVYTSNVSTGNLTVSSAASFNNSTIVAASFQHFNSSNTFSTSLTGITTNAITVSVSYGITSAGVVTGSSFNATSDYRIKGNIMNIDTSINLDSLRPVYYFNKQINKNDYGFVAHEVEEIFPCLVQGEKDGSSNQSINYNGIFTISVHEIQKLKKENRELKERVKKLEETVEMIIEKLEMK
jgi:hypothetical protein